MEIKIRFENFLTFEMELKFENTALQLCVGREGKTWSQVDFISIDKLFFDNPLNKEQVTSATQKLTLFEDHKISLKEYYKLLIRPYG